MKYTIFFVFTLFSLSLHGQTFQQAFKGGSTSNDFARSVVVDKSNYIYIAGIYSGSMTLGVAPNQVTLNTSGGNDVFLAKYKPCGVELVWAVKIGSSGDDRSIYQKLQLAIDSLANVYLAGAFEATATFTSRTGGAVTRTSRGNKDYFLVKYDSSGTRTWVQNGGGGSLDLAHSVDVDINGNVYLTGTFADTGVLFFTNPTGAGASISKNSSSIYEDIFVAKYNSAGVLQWVNTAGGGQADVSTGINVDNSGNVYVCGIYGYNSSSATFGAFTINNNFSWGAFIAKLNASGNWVWVQNAGSGAAADEYAWGVYEKNNLIYLVGNFTSTTTFTSRTGPAINMSSVGGNDGYIIKFDSAGKIINWRKDGLAGEDMIQDVTMFDDKYLLITGMFNSGSKVGNINLSTSGGYDVFFARFDTSLINTNTVLKGGGAGDDFGYDIAADVNGRPVVVGQFSGTASFGVSNLSAAGGSDFFCTKADISLVQPLALNPGPFAICPGDSVRLVVKDSTMAGSFSWLRNGALMSGQNQFFYYAKSIGQYRFVRTQCGMSDTSAVINVTPQNIMAYAGPDKSILIGDSVLLSGAGTPLSSYHWSPSATLSDSTLLGPYAKPNVSTQYVLRVTNGGCVAYDSVWVYVNSGTCEECSQVYQVNDSLVLCYLFNGDANDLSGNGNHGNLFGATLSTDRFGNTGGAYSFNGSSQYIEVPNSTSISSPAARLTTVFWVQVNGWSNQFGVNYASILSKSNSATNCQYRVSLKDNGVSVINNGKYWDFNGTGINLNTWYHIAVVFNNSTSTYYVNGVYAGQSTSPGTFAFNSGNSMYIGRDDPGTTDYFGGKIDELRVFTRALSPAEIMQLYSRSFTQFANAGIDTSVCAGDSIRLTASGGITHAWYPQQGLSDTTGQMPFVQPNQNRTYVLKATRGACTDLDTVSVTYIPVGVNAGSDASVCPGKSVQLNATGTGVIGWRTSSALNDSNVSNPIALPITTSNFIAKSSNAYCRKYDTILVTVKSPQPIDAGAAQIICLGDTVQLAATAGLSAYRWTPSNTMDDSTIYNPKASPSTSTLFTVYATESQGCEVSDTVTVLVTSGITGNITNTDTVICSGATVQLWATGGTKYTWTPVGGLSSTLIHNPIATVSSTVRYRVEVSNGGNCKGYDSVLISVNPAPEVKVNDTAFCEGGKAFLYATPLAAGTYQYEWSTSDTASSVNVSPQVTKEYYVRVKSAGCYSLMDTAKVIVWPAPLAKFAATPDKGFPPHKVYIQNQSIGAVNYFWNFGDNAGITGRSFDTNYVYSDTGTYRIRLIAESNFGCKDTAWKFVKVSDSLSIYIPNIFTPNEDGTNDTWEVTLIGVSDYSVMIFNRWGEKLFEQDYSSGTNVVRWNGRYKGSDVADGVYFFILNYTVRGVGRNERAGPIHIVR